MHKPIRVPTDLRARQPSSGRVRISFLQRCQVTGESGEQTGLVCDLSTAGLYVRLDRIPPTGSLVRITFQLFPGDEHPLDLEAEVVWCNAGEDPPVPDLPPGCGLRFRQVKPEDAASIAALVRASTTPVHFHA